MSAINTQKNHNLPIKFVIEDNGLSTNTPTKETWVKKVKYQEEFTIISTKENFHITEQVDGYYFKL